jgi:peroxiredoxin
MPTIGQTAPDFTLKDQDQKEVKLSDFKGKKKVVLVFYPLDWSPVCTKEHACMVRATRCAGARRECRQRVVAQSLRR